MNPWTPSSALTPEIELLVRRWQLPPARIPEVERLLEVQREGSTALALETDAAGMAADWGPACRLVPPGATPDLEAPRPLLRRSHGGHPYLQAWRFYHAESAIAQALLTQARQSPPALARSTEDSLASLGPAEVNARQTQAIACALAHRLALITGGPGTGKTHTLARLLALLFAASPDRTPVVHLAAPTGKAADRMKEAIESAANHLGASIPDPTRQRLKRVAAGACTLHRLLGFNPSTGRCRFSATEPLRTDVVIIDECSMVDTLMWQALLAALPPEARLILVGDPHQLESVAAGDVLGSLVRFARGRKTGGLSEVWVELTESHRFRHRPGIGQLASAVVNLQADTAMTLLANHLPPTDGTVPTDGLAWLGDHGGKFAWANLPPAVQNALATVADAVSPGDALAALPQVRLLSAHRGHTLGAAGLNTAIHHHLAGRAGLRRAPNRPLIINHNDPETGLINGSVGIEMEVDGVRAAYFPATADRGEPRRIALSLLPDHSPAWALTIHRSQGSEFDHVVVILPPEESPLATRELLYTAITRAKECVHVWGAEPTVRAALGPRALRCTLLEASLENNWA